jgi:two-component system nitrogen regulation response regulator GlnG
VSLYFIFFERALIDIAFKNTSGRKKDSSDLLCWGRNTLTRKIKELDVLKAFSDIWRLNGRI